MTSTEVQQEHLIKIKNKLSDRRWRLNNLYKIKDVSGTCVQFKLNPTQNDFYEKVHFFNVILKARQQGFSTFIAIYMLDAAIFNSNQSCGIIAQGLKEAGDLFENKVKFAYDNLPEWLKTEVSCTIENTRELKFNNGSSIVVGTSLRGGTFQKLHVSEYGKISAKFPEKAREIKTGAFNTVHAGQQIFVESTAEGQGGEFYELVGVARKLEQENKQLSPLDPKFHFYPWYINPLSVLSDEDTVLTVIPDDLQKYFRTLEKDHGISTTANQQAWYAKKAVIMNDDMKREYPSTADESFLASVEGSIYGRQMAALRRAGQLTRVPWEPRSLVHTFWDIGNRDYMAIWCFQQVGLEYRMIRYIQSAGQDLTWYANELGSYGYSFGSHYLPHDGNRTQLGLKNNTTKELLESLGVKPCIIVPRTNDVRGDIETKCKTMLPKVWFDTVHCAAGIKALDNYKKVWDENLSIWRDEPKHDEFSHGSDAFRTFAVGWKEIQLAKPVSFALSGGQAPL